MVGVAFICCTFVAKIKCQLIFYQNLQYNHPRKKFTMTMTSYLMLILNACVSGTI